MNSQNHVQEMLTELSKKTAILQKEIPELGNAKLVAVPTRRLNGKAFPIYLLENNGRYVATDMGLIAKETSALTPEQQGQIQAFLKSKLKFHDIEQDNGMFIHTPPHATAAQAINQLLGFETVIYFVLDAAL